MNNEIAWDLQRSDSGQLLQATKNKKFSFADVEERKLNLADTEGLTVVTIRFNFTKINRSLAHISPGMFLLMGIGYLVAVSVLISEIVGGCAKRCRQFARRKSRSTFPSSLHPNTSNRPSYVSQYDDPPLSSQERFRRLVLKGFRRNSEQSTSSMASTEAQDLRHRHARSGSISVSVNPGSMSPLPVNERWVKTKDEPDIDEISNRIEVAEIVGIANRSNQVTASTKTDPSSEEKFGEMVEH